MLSRAAIADDSLAFCKVNFPYFGGKQVDEVLFLEEQL